MTTTGSPAQRLQAAFSLLDRLAKVGGVRELTAISVALDNWLRFETPIPLADGSTYAEKGFPLDEVAEGKRYLLAGGRLITVPGQPDATPEIIPLVETPIDLAQLATRLRPVVLENYVEGSLADLEPRAAVRLVGELLALVWDLDEGGRAQVLQALADAMHSGEGWNELAARLKGGFERGLSDRSPVVRATCAHALVRMGAGLAPNLPTGDPARVIPVLFAVPHVDVHVAALRALAELPSEALARVAKTVEPYVHNLLADPDSETRWLAGEIELRLATGGPMKALAESLVSESRLTRIGALQRLAALARDLDPFRRDDPAQRDALRTLETLLPKVLAATDDRDPAVRAAAIEVLAPLIEDETTTFGERVVETLLTSGDADVQFVAIEHLKSGRRPVVSFKAGLDKALAGPAVNRPAVVALLSSTFRQLPPAEAAERYSVLMSDRDPIVRRAAIDLLPTEIMGRPNVKDPLVMTLAERLRDTDPAVRIAAARAVTALGYPGAVDMATSLLTDPDTEVRRATLEILKTHRTDTTGRSEQLAAATSTLFDLAAAATPDGRMRWQRALHTVTEQVSARTPELLAAVLSTLPAHPEDPFQAFAIGELDTQLLALTDQPDDTAPTLVEICRRLVEPPTPQPEHAVRLASSRAAEDPAALDFLSTLYRETAGTGAEAALKAIAALATQPKSPEVIQELRDQLDHASDPPLKAALQRAMGA